MHCPKIQKTNYLRKSLTSEHKKVNKKTCWFLAEKIRLSIFAETKNEKMTTMLTGLPIQVLKPVHNSGVVVVFNL